MHPGFVRRVLARAATRSDADPDGLQLVAGAVGGPRALERAFGRFARMALDDPLVGRALRPRRAQRLGPGGRISLRASVPPLGLMLWRIPASGAAVRIRRSGSSHVAVVVRRGASEHTLASGSLRLARGRGAVLVLVAGGAASRMASGSWSAADRLLVGWLTPPFGGYSR